MAKRIPLKPLAHICRSLSTMLDAGVGIRKAFKLAANKTSNPLATESLKAVVKSISQGNDIASSLRAQDQRFPDLFVDLVDVAEQTGSMPEVFRRLSDHYENTVRMRKDFYQQISWPVIQFIAAVFVIAFLILILGWIGESNAGGPTNDILGWGLLGTRGAITWLGMVFGTLGIIYLAYRVAQSSLAGQKFLDPVLLGIPVVGTCIRNFAIARFSWAFAITQQSGMSIRPSLEASLRATANGAYINQGPPIWNSLRAGDNFSEAIGKSGIFPPDFVHMVDVAETSGTIPETLDRLSPQFEEEARRSLQKLVGALGWLVWGMVAMFIVYVIFSVFLTYIGMINSTLNDIR